jgi:hypothetical protein
MCSLPTLIPCQLNCSNNMILPLMIDVICVIASSRHENSSPLFTKGFGSYGDHCLDLTHSPQCNYTEKHFTYFSLP